jgi:hypothetical protein
MSSLFLSKIPFGHFGLVKATVIGALAREAGKTRSSPSGIMRDLFTAASCIPEAQARKLLELEHDDKSGGYIVKGFTHED